MAKRQAVIGHKFNLLNAEIAKARSGWVPNMAYMMFLTLEWYLVQFTMFSGSAGIARRALISIGVEMPL